MCARIYAGDNFNGEPILIVHGGYAFRGSMPVGLPMMRIDGDDIRLGAATWGRCIATVRGNHVYRSDRRDSTPIATIRGEKVFRGSLAVGRPVATFRDGDTNTGAVAAAYFLLVQPKESRVAPERGLKARELRRASL
jgi:hypothetical protein